MGRVVQLFFGGIVVFTFWAGTGLPATAQANQIEALRQRFRELERWLGSDAEAPGWRQYLKLKQLAAELDKDAAADRGVVREVLDRFESGQPGLERRRFAAVRTALARWLDELPQWEAEQLPEAAQAAKQIFVVVTDADAEQERQRLMAAVGALKRFLATARPQDAEQWRASLRWDQLQTELPASDARPNFRNLLSISELYFQDLAGLERKEFIAVRQALDRYIALAQFAANPNAQKYFETHLDTLAERLASYQQQPTTDDAIAIGRILGWMERFGQAREVVEATRLRHSRPNLFLEVSEALMQAGVEQNVDETAAVNEIILGTRVRGNARLTGQVTLNLVASDKQAAMDILLNGSTVSDSVGYNGPVRVFSRGYTSVAAKKRLVLDETGIAGHPATARCRTSTRVGRVDAGRLIRHVAMRRIEQTQPQAEAIASRRAAGRVAASVDHRSADLLRDANVTFNEKFRLPLVRRGGFPQSLQFRTTDDALQVTMLQAGRDQLAAPGAPPPLEGRFDLAVRRHESLVGNLSQAVLGGVRMTDVALAEMIEELTGEVPEGLKITPDSEPWAITFASELPIEVRFEDQTVRILIRGRRFERSNQEVRRPTEISATYTVEKLPDRARLVRQGEVQLDFVGRPSLGAADIAMKTFLQRKFEELFKPEIVSEGLVLPERWQGMGKLVLQQLDCRDAWLALGWLKPPPPPAEDQIASN